MERFPGGIPTPALQPSQPSSSFVLRSGGFRLRGSFPHSRVGGIGIHQHRDLYQNICSPGFSETVYGRKRWFLTAPEDQPLFHPNRTTLQWLLEDYQTVKQEVSWHSELSRLDIDQIINCRQSCTSAPSDPERPSTSLMAGGTPPSILTPLFLFQHFSVLDLNCSGFRQLWRTPYERMYSASYVRETGERSNLSKVYLSDRS